MKNGIKADIYYFLLEWKDANLSEFIEMHGRRSLNSFNPQELHKLHQSILAEQKQKELEAIRIAAIVKDETDKAIGDRVKTQYSGDGTIVAEDDSRTCDEPQKVSWVVKIDKNDREETWYDEALVKI